MAKVEHFASEPAEYMRLEDQGVRKTGPNSYIQTFMAIGMRGHCKPFGSLSERDREIMAAWNEAFREKTNSESGRPITGGWHSPWYLGNQTKDGVFHSHGKARYYT